jgi:hypothetical protein
MATIEEVGQVVGQVARLSLADLYWFNPRREDGSFIDAVRALRGQSGAYLIRDLESGDLLYVGQSKSGRLYQTATRHFQEWGPPHDRRSFVGVPVEMAVIVCPPWAAEEVQFYLIQRWQPSVNTVQGDGGEGEIVDAEVPF